MPTKMRSALLTASAVLAIAGCNNILGIERARLWTASGGQASTGVGGTAGAGTAGAAAGGSAGTSGGGTAGATTGGSAGTSTGGTAGATTGGAAQGGAAGSAGLGGGQSGSAGTSPTGGAPPTGGSGGATPTGGAAPEGGMGGAGGQGGCAAELDSDPANCGTCGHSCVPGGCRGGVCVKFTHYEYPNAYGGDLAVIAGSTPQRLLATGHGLIDIPLAGPATAAAIYDSPASSGTSGYSELATAGADYFVGSSAQTGAATIYRGSADELQAATAPSAWRSMVNADAMTMDADYVYWADCEVASPMIRRLPRVGMVDGVTVPDQVATNLGVCPQRIRIDGTTLWFTALSPPGTGLYSIDLLKTFPVTPTVCSVGGTRGLAIGAQHVYFSTWNTTETYYSSGTGSVCRVPKSSPGCPSLADVTCLGGTQNGPISLALDDNWLYFANEGVWDATGRTFTGGGIYRATLTLTGAPKALAEPEVRPRVVVVSANAVHWLTTGSVDWFIGVYGIAK